MLAELLLHEIDLVSLDLETTGIAPAYDRVTEVAALRFSLRPDGRVVPGPLMETLVQPDRKISAQITEITGIDDALVAEAPPFRAIWDELAAFLQPDGDRPLVIMAHSVRFDLAFLAAEVGRLPGDVTFEAPHAVCTLAVAQRVFPQAPRFALGPLVDWLGCRAEGRGWHRALDDALHTRNLFARCVDEASARRFRDLRVMRTVPAPTVAELEVAVPDALTPLVDAIDDGRRMWISYRAGTKGRGQRPVTPLGFYNEQGVAYLRAVCHLDEVAKSFRCDRIRGAPRPAVPGDGAGRDGTAPPV